MGYSDIVRDVENRKKTLTVYNADPDDPIGEEISAYFSDRSIEVCADATPSGRPEEVVVLERDGSLLSVVDLDTMRELVEQTPTGTGFLGEDERPYRHVLEQIEEATFTSSNQQQMLATAHEIEDRAFRVGNGTLYAGFQAAEHMLNQRQRYEEIADQGVDVSIYIPPEQSVPAVRGVDVHEVPGGEVRDFWVVAFDGGDAPSQQCALLAQERSPERYYGFWTYDPEVVDRVVRRVIELENRVSP